MAKFTSPLDHVRVAAPCPADWDGMIGTDRVRFCGQCSLNVYNLSAMSKSEAESFISGREGGRVCVRFYRRSDGSILTRNCPVGLRAIRRRLSRVAQALSTAALSFLAGFGLYNLREFRRHEISTGVLAVENPMRHLPVVMGDMAVEAPPAAIQGKVMLMKPNQPERSRRK
jgi:hypothetical protein